MSTIRGPPPHFKEDMLMRTTIIATAAALLFAGSALAQTTDGASKTRRDLQPQTVPQSSGTAQVPPSTGSRTRKDEKSDVPATQGSTPMQNGTDSNDPNKNPRGTRAPR